MNLIRSDIQRYPAVSGMVNRNQFIWIDNFNILINKEPISVFVQ